MKVLLHTCCGPCASACVPRLKDEGHEVALFYSNCNIDSAAEFEKRRAEAEKLAARDGVAIFADEYDHAAWLREVAAGFEDEPEKGKRCERCFRFSLARAAAFAATRGYDAFATSLTVSPHKVSKVIFEVGNSVAGAGAGASSGAGAGASSGAGAGADASANANAGAKFLAADFKKKEGFKLSVRRSEELGLYRQSYCGCEFSRRRLTKDAIRAEMRARRKLLSAESRAAASASVAGQLLAVDFPKDAPIAVYLATAEEIDLAPFIEAAAARRVTFAAPRWNGEIYEMARLNGLGTDSLRAGPMGVAEPKAAEIVAPSEIGAWIVPGLAFTRAGARLGYGGGWYDRLLGAARAGAMRIGVCHAFQVVDSLPAEPHDIPCQTLAIAP